MAVHIESAYSNNYKKDLFSTILQQAKYPAPAGAKLSKIDIFMRVRSFGAIQKERGKALRKFFLFLSAKKRRNF